MVTLRFNFIKGMSLRIIIILASLCMRCQGDTVLSGDVTVGGLFKIQNQVNEICDGFSVLSVKSVEAVKWIFRNLNEANYIPGVKIGFDVWPTCGMVTMATDRTVDLLLRIREERSNLSSSALIGLIGPEYSSEAQKVSYMLSTQRSEDRVLQVGFSTTAASLSDTNTYSNFARVVPSDSVQSGVMVALMKELHWNYIAVIHDDDVYGTEGRDGLMTQAAANSICIAKTFSLPTGALSLTNLNQMLTDIITNSESPISGVVVLASSAHVNSILNAATKLRDTYSDPLSFILSEAVGLSDAYFKVNGALLAAAKGVYVVNPPRMYLNEFENHWQSIFKNVSMVSQESQSNPWLGHIYKQITGCLPSNDPKLPGCSNLDASQLASVSVQSTWTSYAVKTAYVIAKHLKKIHDVTCPLTNGVCSDFRTLLHEDRSKVLDSFRKDFTPIDLQNDFPFTPVQLENVSMTFNGTNDVQYWKGFPNYEVHQYRKCINDQSLFCFEKLGSYRGTQLDIDKSVIREYRMNQNDIAWPNINFAQCAQNKRCSSCLKANIADEIYFKDGDLIIGAIVPVFDAGTDSPMACGSIRKKNGNEIVQAFEYAVNVVNSKTKPYDTLFPGKKIGFLIINSCDKVLVMKQKLLELLNKGVIVVNGKTINLHEKLLAFAGPYSSGLSMASSDIFKEFKYAQVAYASTANSLVDRAKYPYYSRVSTPDGNQARAMIKLIKHEIYSSSYIQIVYSKGTYGEAGRDEVKKFGTEQGVCVVQEVEIDDGSNYNVVLTELRKRPSAKIVILFVRSHQIEQVIEALDRDMQHGEFLFIGSEAWGFRPEVVVRKPKLVGSLILSLQLPENRKFTQYLNTITASAPSENPWLQEFIAAKYDCYNAQSFDKTHSKLCDPDMRLADNVTYVQEIWTPFALNAMFVLLGGCYESFIELCGSNSPTVCEQYRRSPGIVRDKIINYKLDLEETGNAVKVFDSNGDGNVGYTIYNLRRTQQNTDEVEYQKVGMYSIDEQSIDIDGQIVEKPEQISLPSVCPNAVECNECKKQKDTANNVCTESAMVSTASEGSTVTALGVVIGVMAIGMIVLIVIVVKMCREMRGSTDSGDDYITPVDMPYNRNDYYAGKKSFSNEGFTETNLSKEPPENTGTYPEAADDV